MKLKIISILLLAVSSLYTYAQADVTSFLDEITINHIQAHEDTLASESMEGRYTGAPGQKLAAKYIANEFAKYGLTPFDPDSENPYYQKFDLYKYHIGTSEMYYNDLYYWSPLYFGSKNISDSIYGKVVYTGYAEDKLLEKLSISKNNIFFFSESVKESVEKIKKISDAYDINTFIVGLPFDKQMNRDIFKDTINDLTSFKELFYYYNYYLTAYRNTQTFVDFRAKNKLFPNIKIDSEKELKILFVPDNISIGLFNKEMDELKKMAKADKRPIKNIAKIKPVEFSYTVNFNPVIYSISTENIVGYIDSDVSDEVIIVGGHYDHLGMGQNNKIYYGADDNASGTTAVLAIAESFSNAVKKGVTLKKDIVFIAYSAEEIGLHGSQFYTEKPLFPLSKTEVVFNLDMIGRDKDDKPENSNTVFLLEWEGGKKYIKNVNKLNEQYTHLNVDQKPGPKDKNLWTYGSDHYSFAKKGVSSIAYFTALHNDYHTPRDTPDKLNYDKMKRIIQLVFLNIWDITYTD